MSAWCALNSARCLETLRPRLLAQNPDLSASSQAMAAAVPITFHRPIAAWFVATQLGAQAKPSAAGGGRGPTLRWRPLQGPELMDVEAAPASRVKGTSTRSAGSCKRNTASVWSRALRQPGMSPGGNARGVSLQPWVG